MYSDKLYTLIFPTQVNYIVEDQLPGIDSLLHCLALLCHTYFGTTCPIESLPTVFPFANLTRKYIFLHFDSLT